MLYFSLKENGKVVTKLSLDDIKWLCKFKIIKKGNTGFVEEDGVESLPFFDDYELTYMNGLAMHNYSEKVIFKLLSTPSFESETLNKFNLIIALLLDKKKVLQVMCD
jgi:hypothetical protein